MLKGKSRVGDALVVRAKRANREFVRKTPGDKLTLGVSVADPSLSSEELEEATNDEDQADNEEAPERADSAGIRVKVVGGGKVRHGSSISCKPANTK